MFLFLRLVAAPFPERRNEIQVRFLNNAGVGKSLDLAAPCYATDITVDRAKSRRTEAKLFVCE